MTGPGFAADGDSVSCGMVARQRGKASGVVEERPRPEVADLHAPSPLGLVRDGVDKSGVRGLGTGKIFRRDNRAVRVDYSKLNHAT